mgnify:CR=1 FL=1
MKIQAYWISTQGRILEVPGRHIEVVCRDPQCFGLTSDYVKSIFTRYQEPLGFEGQAREEIMGQLIETDWIRLRFLSRPYMWKAQVNKLDSSTVRNLVKWDKRLMISESDPHMEILIVSGRNPEGLRLRLKDLRI